MASARFAWGIDVGNRALKAIKLVRGENGLRIDDFEVIEHESVLSNAGDNKEALIQSALANFVQRHTIKGGSAAISVSGVSSFARFIKLPPVEPKKIPEIVRFEAIQQIPFPLDDVEWSYQLFASPGSPDVEVGIFAMRRELINQHIKHFTDVDLNVQVVQMNPLAVYNAMYFDGQIQGTTMIVDLGAENTDLIIADGETIWLRSIPIGGNNFTDVLVKSFKLPFAKAEDLKRNANTSKYARQIFQAMRPVFADLVAEIQRSIGFYSSVHRDSRIKKILALGGTFRLAGLQKYLQQNLQLDVQKLNALSAGAPADAKLAATFNQNLLSLVSAYGLAIQAMGDSKVTSSLLPMKIRREKLWRDKTKWFGAAAATFLLGSSLAAGGYYASEMAYKSQDDLRDQEKTTLDLATSLDQKWTTEVETHGQADRILIQNIRGTVEYRNLWANLFNDIMAALPKPPEGYPSPAYLQTHPRNQRPIIVIDKMDSDYSSDLQASAMSASSDQQMQPGEEPIPVGARGFVITLALTTPHDDGFVYVIQNFLPSLRKFDRAAMTKWNADHPDNPKHYYIAKVFSPWGQKQIRDDGSRLAQMQQSFNAAQSLLGIQPGGAAPPAQVPMVNFVPAPVGNAGAGNDPHANIDRVTGEDRLSDWEMSVQLLVVIDPQGPGPAGP